MVFISRTLAARPTSRPGLVVRRRRLLREAPRHHALSSGCASLRRSAVAGMWYDRTVPCLWTGTTTPRSRPKTRSQQPVAQDRDRAYLIVLAGTSVGEMYKIADETTVIGRGSAGRHPGRRRRHLAPARRDRARGRAHRGRAISARPTAPSATASAIDEHALNDGDKIQVGSTTILKFTFHDSLDESFQRQMYESALRDGLTKIFNKKYFLDRLESEFAYAIRHKSPLSLVMFDIDHFKQINDTHGHLAGDYALATLAQGGERDDPPGGRVRALRRRGVRGHLPRRRSRRRGARSASASAAGRRRSSFVYQRRSSIKVTVSVGVAAVHRRRHARAAGADRRRRRRALSGQARGPQPRRPAGTRPNAPPASAIRRRGRSQRRARPRRRRASRGAQRLRELRPGRRSGRAGRRRDR